MSDPGYERGRDLQWQVYDGIYVKKVNVVWRCLLNGGLATPCNLRGTFTAIYLCNRKSWFGILNEMLCTFFHHLQARKTVNCIKNNLKCTNRERQEHNELRYLSSEFEKMFCTLIGSNNYNNNIIPLTTIDDLPNWSSMAGRVSGFSLLK